MDYSMRGISLGATLQDVTGSFMAANIPYNGKVRAAVGWEITGMTSHTYWLIVLYGISGQPLTNWWGTAAQITGLGQSRVDNIDTQLSGIAPGTYDAVVYVAETFDISSHAVSGVYDSKTYTGAITIQQSLGARIVSVNFSSV